MSEQRCPDCNTISTFNPATGTYICQIDHEWYPEWLERMKAPWRIDWMKVTDKDHGFIGMLIDREALVPVEPCEPGPEATMSDHVVSITFTIIGGRDEPDAVVLVMASGRKVTYRR